MRSPLSCWPQLVQVMPSSRSSIGRTIQSRWAWSHSSQPGWTGSFRPWGLGGISSGGAGTSPFWPSAQRYFSPHSHWNNHFSLFCRRVNLLRISWIEQEVLVDEVEVVGVLVGLIDLVDIWMIQQTQDVYLILENIGVLDELLIDDLDTSFWVWGLFEGGLVDGAVSSTSNGLHSLIATLWWNS